MTRKVSGFVKVVQVLESLPKARAQWREIAGEDFPPIEGWLRPTDEKAALYPCAPGCPADCGREIRESRDSIVGICRERQCEKVTLSRDEVVGYEIDLEAIGGAIARTLGATPQAPEQTPVWRWWTIGTLGRGGLPLPVILSTSLSGRETSNGVAALVGHGLAPFVLILPKARALDTATATFLKRERCTLVIAEDAFGIDANAQSVSRGELLSAVAPAAVAKPQRPTSDSLASVFRCDGDTWTIAFAGKTIHPKDRKGLRYLALLLQSPGRDLHAAELSRLVAGKSVAPVLGSAGNVYDEADLAKLRAQLRSIDEDLEEARQNSDLGRAAALEEERDQFVRAIARGVGLGGRMRREADDADKLRKSVCKAVSDAIDALRSQHEALHRHLKMSVRLGQSLSYLPEQPAAWAA